MAADFRTIIIPTTPHPDVVVGIFLLKKFGNQKYQGISAANLEVSQELPQGQTSQSLQEQGILCLDLGNGPLDHHQKSVHLSKLVAQDLGISQDPALAKLLAYTERDDKFGLGTISTDQLDKAFGLSGLITAANKTFQNPEQVLAAATPFLEAHYMEEKKRTVEMPAEFSRYQQEGKVETFTVQHRGKPIKVAVIESDNVSMAGWLKSSLGIQADVVCQRMSSGYTNIVTKQAKNIDLRWVAAYMRNDEFQLQEKELAYSFDDLQKPGKIAEIPEWYYDTATNSVLNGGANPKGILPTAIPLHRVKTILRESLAKEVQEA